MEKNFTVTITVNYVVKKYCLFIYLTSAAANKAPKCLKVPLTFK